MAVSAKTMESFERWNVHHRLQHALLALSMTVLILTGFAIKYRYVGWSPWLVAFLGGFHNVYVTHLVGAVTMAATVVYHVIYLLLSYRPLKTGWAMMPSWKDVTDCITHLRYLAGLSQEPPRFGRYNYLEKFEYWSMAWGLPVMGISGLSLWFPEIAGRILPYWVIEAFRVAHSNEAFIAFFALAVGHMFASHLAPGVFPMSAVWLTGRMPLWRLAEEHPDEYADLVKRGVIPPEPHPEYIPTTNWQKFVQSPSFVLLEMVPYVGIVVWSLVTFVPMLLLH